MIRTENLSFRYPGAEHDAIRGLSLQVQRGSMFGLLGPNGSGKTTLISILTGLLVPTSGTAQIDGKNLPAQSREIQTFSALVPQEYAFYPRLTIAENLHFFGSALGIQGAELRSRIEEAVRVAGLASFVRYQAGKLSGGLKRRLNLAIGLLNRPKLLFLDEPTVGIDPQSRHFILDAIRQINAEGTTVIYTTHYMEEVELLCDEIGILDKGQLLARGTLRQLLNDSPAHALTLNLMDAPDTTQKAALAGIDGIQLDGQQLRLPGCGEAEFRQVIALLDSQGLHVSRAQYGYGNLEELFMHLTGRQLRD